MLRKFVIAVAAMVAVVALAPPASAQKEQAAYAAPVQGGPIEGAPTLELTELTGDHPTGDMAVMASNLPFNFTFDFGRGLASRNFWPSSEGKACVSLRATGGVNIPGGGDWRNGTIQVTMWDADGIDSQVGAPVSYSMNGNYHGYCWSPLYTNHEHYFELRQTGAWTVQGDGWASAT